MPRWAIRSDWHTSWIASKAVAPYTTAMSNTYGKKFGQLRREITRESEDESEQHDASQDSVTSPPSDQNQSVSNEAVNGSHPSKAWYVLPIFLGVLGGLIAYVKLRKRNRSVAYKTLGLGVGITMLFLVPMLTARTLLRRNRLHGTPTKR